MLSSHTQTCQLLLKKLILTRKKYPVHFFYASIQSRINPHLLAHEYFHQQSMWNLVKTNYSLCMFMLMKCGVQQRRSLCTTMVLYGKAKKYKSGLETHKQTSLYWEHFMLVLVFFSAKNVQLLKKKDITCTHVYFKMLAIANN